jgi:nucleoside phosphorylase
LVAPGEKFASLAQEMAKLRKERILAMVDMENTSIQEETYRLSRYFGIA